MWLAQMELSHLSHQEKQRKRSLQHNLGVKLEQWAPGGHDSQA